MKQNIGQLAQDIVQRAKQERFEKQAQAELEAKRATPSQTPPKSDLGQLLSKFAEVLRQTSPTKVTLDDLERFKTASQPEGLGNAPESQQIGSNSETDDASS